VGQPVVRERSPEQADQLAVLLVEDDEEDYLLTKDMLTELEGAKHELRWVSDSRSALEAARVGDYDVCLVDYRLGAEDGIELVRALVSDGYDMPVIVLTGHSDRDVDVEATRAGAADYLVKGEASPVLLERTIRYAMRSHADLRALHDKEIGLQKLNDNLELRVNERTAELKKTISELADEKRRVESFYSFCRTIASGIDAEALGRMILGELGDFAQAEIGVLYSVDSVGGEGLQLLAARGLEPRSLPRTLPATIPEGLIRRALRALEGGDISTPNGSPRTSGEPVTVSDEVTVPLLKGERQLGVLFLAREDGQFSRPVLRAIDHLAKQAAVAVADALSFRRMGWLANINRAVLDATVDAIHLVDLEGATLVANTALEHLVSDVFELPSVDALNAYHARLSALTTDPDSYRAITEAIAANQEHVAVDEFELTDCRRSFQRYTAPVRDSGGSMIGRIFVFREVTADRAAERLKSDLIATVSHELRTPLASILGFSELLLNHDQDAASLERHLEIIHNAAKRLTQLINGFLDLQRIEAGRFTLALEPMALDELVREEVQLYTGESVAHTLELELPPEPLPILGERDRIAQVVGNLLSNAIKYSPSGGSVSVKAESVGDRVRFSVRDRGLGIPGDQQQDIFTRFFRADSSVARAIGGTGLGLALSREIIHAHGGRIDFDSVEGVGSTFWFELPAA
jgi:signal transduction histidine kinase/DNA-binding response OmpR family regulator